MNLLNRLKKYFRCAAVFFDERIYLRAPFFLRFRIRNFVHGAIFVQFVDQTSTAVTSSISSCTAGVRLEKRLSPVRRSISRIEVRNSFGLCPVAFSWGMMNASVATLPLPSRVMTILKQNGGMQTPFAPKRSAGLIGWPSAVV